MPRRSLVPLLALLLAGGASAQADPDAQRAIDLALREWSHAVGTTGYVYAAPLLEVALAEYRQTAGLGADLSGPRGLFAHAMGGRRATHETAWRPAPDPDVLASSAWLDVKQQPYVLFVPPLEGHWYSVRFLDAFGNLVAAFSPRSHGSVGGWTLLAHSGYEGPRPPRVPGEVRSPTSLLWVIVEIAATAKGAATVHERYQARLKLLPLELYRRSPGAAELANAPPQTAGPPLIRATEEMRGGLEAFRVINQRLRQIEPAPAEEALLALFDRAGFGPRVRFDTGRLAAPQLAGLHDAARDGRRALRDLRLERSAQKGWSAAPPPEPGDLLSRAVRQVAAPPAGDVLVLEAYRDADGRRLDGRYDYRIRFAPGQHPPAEAFWSIAAYSAESERLFEGAGDRTSVGSLDGGLAGADEALEIWLSSDAPEDRVLRAHWLPVRHEPFFLVARLRAPAAAALDGSWSMPAVVPADD